MSIGRYAWIFIVVGTAWSQGPPPTDIFVADLGPDLKPGSFKNMTDRDGYDNQPAFLDENRLLFTSIRADGQADIYRLEVGGGIERVTFTQESEYSPTPMPGGTRFSAVRVEFDGTQRLWAFPLEGGAGRLLLNRAPVGYHAWLDAQRVGLFILGEPPSLHLGDLRRQTSRRLLGGIGRGLKRAPGPDALTVVEKPQSGSWRIVRVGLPDGESEALIDTLEGSEDFAWTADGALLMAKGAALYAAFPGREKTWRQIADLSGQGLSGITRIAVSPGMSRIALVANR